jgi:hypothetical protein
VDEARRAVVSAFVIDRSFPAFYADPRTREAALAQLGRTVRRVHELPLPPDADSKDPRELLAASWSGLVANFALPAFAGDAVRRVLTEEAPARERAPVLSHNDVNPANLVYDGENLLLLDWETAGPNDPFYDLAAISVFLRMDEGTCQRLLAAYDGEPVSRLPARFAYSRRLHVERLLSSRLSPGAHFLRAHAGGARVPDVCGRSALTGAGLTHCPSSLGDGTGLSRHGAASARAQQPTPTHLL